MRRVFGGTAAAGVGAGILGGLLAGAAALGAPPAVTPVPTGAVVTPLAAPGAVYQTLDPGLAELPEFRAGQPAASALSPDGRTLAVVTNGYNRNADLKGAWAAPLSKEYLFLFDVSSGTPRKTQVLKVDDAFLGLAFSPAGDRIYLSRGVDDRVEEFVRGPDGYAPGRSIPLGHAKGLGIGVGPMAAGLSVSPDGRRLLVANLQNDSVSLTDLEAGRVLAEQDLRPGVIDPALGPRPGGTFPMAVAFAGPTRAYVAVLRDREILSLDLSGDRIAVRRRIPVRGQPTALLVSPERNRLYAALDNTDGVAVLDTRADVLLETDPTAGPAAILPATAKLGGVGSNALALSPDGRTLYVANGGQNAVAVLTLGARALGGEGARRGRGTSVAGLIPTGWEPSALAVARDGSRLFISNLKSPPGPNPKACRDTLSIHGKGACASANQYVWQLEKGGLLTVPTPSPAELQVLTRQTALNNNYVQDAGARADAAVMAELRRRIRHVIYVIKENRTYDQVLGDLGVGNGDPRLALLGAPLTPNQHALARSFVDLDNFFDSGESSNTGWQWSTAARTVMFTEREAPVNYAGRGLQYDQEGDNRNVNVAYADPAERRAANPATPADPNVLAGGADVAAPDGPDGEAGQGYLWNAALKAGLRIRNWGFFGDLSRYEADAGPNLIPLERDPASKSLQVFFASNAAIRPYTDPYFRGFDQAFPDFWRLKEWDREFTEFEAKGEAPNLMLVRLAHDHFGSFSRGIDGVNSVETEAADNDYAVGRLVERVSRSRFKDDTLIFIVEDDAQDGADHVDAHRSIAFVVGPYVKKGQVVSRRYTTVNLVKTIEAVLGLAPLNLNDASARPMADVFDLKETAWSFHATPSRALEATALPIPREEFAAACPIGPQRSSAYWEAAMAGQDFRSEDQLDTPRFNLALWKGLRPGVRPPTTRSGADLRSGRVERPCGARLAGR